MMDRATVAILVMTAEDEGGRRYPCSSQRGPRSGAVPRKARLRPRDRCYRGRC
jgi:hypothetical protein